VTDTPLVLLPAFPFDSRIWDRVTAGLTEHLRVITHDTRGFGKAPLGDREPDLAVVAEDVIARLDELGVDRFVVGGNSMGGYISMAVLRAVPSRVAGLVLVDTRANADAPEARETRLAAAERARREGTGWVADAMLPVLLGPTTLERRPDVVETVRRLVDEVSPDTYAWAQRAMAARPDSAGLLRDADIPALIAHGDEDAIIPLDAARTTAELLPRAELVVLKESGHLPPLEVPATLTATVLRWWESAAPA
jgi:pimeloyl-ACP methyl ester carboxylesterase